jgi:hypothetical protein
VSVTDILLGALYGIVDFFTSPWVLPFVVTLVVMLVVTVTVDIEVKDPEPETWANGLATVEP